jgi:fructoselysine transporter
MSQTAPQLQRRVGLLQASAINMIDMVGIGPFLTMPFVMEQMQGNYLLPWLFGALVAFADSCVWAELGAAYPLAGGSYQFLKIAYKDYKIAGKLMPFLLVWQTLFISALVVASAAIGFSNYVQEFVTLAPWQGKLVSGGVVLLAVALLYRRIGVVVLGTIVWIIITGLGNPQHAVHLYQKIDNDGFFSSALWAAIGMASVKTIYSFLGYYNVCHLGGEIVNPQKNIPRSIFLSVACITVLYLLMNYSVGSVVPVAQASEKDLIIPKFFHLLGQDGAASVATVLILVIALASLFAVMLGYSRVLYAAAADGNFFRIFGKLHPTKNFPYISLLLIGVLAFCFSLLFKMKEVIQGILAMRILVQFVSQAVGLMLLRKKYGSKELPFRMWLYPLPLLIAIMVWLFIFYSTSVKFMIIAGVLIATGSVVFAVVQHLNRKSRILQGRNLSGIDSDA